MSTNNLITNVNYTKGDRPLAIIVIGASGDLAKRKTYPALFNLFRNNQLPQNQTIIYGFGRTSITSSSLRDKMRPFLRRQDVNDDGHLGSSKVSQLESSFLNICFYQRGSGYDDVQAFEHMNHAINQHLSNCNYLFYLAIPPNLFYTVASTITKVFSTKIPKKYIRILFEKPFGRDTTSYLELSNSLVSLKQLDEMQMYRIDHYLGKTMVRAIPSIRFRNSWARDIWNRQSVEIVFIEMTETLGTNGRGGYFDQYGIIRDIIQNHLLQVMCLIAMEEPQSKSQPRSQQYGSENNNDEVRDSKCKLLSCTRIPSMDDCVLGQYEGYTDDVTVPDDSCTPTYAAVRMYIDNDRWRNVPFILVAGKALEKRRAEVRLRLRGQSTCSELSITIQPEYSLSLTTNVEVDCIGVENKKRMMLNFQRHEGGGGDDAYSRLIHDALKGDSSSFVRDDELKLSWELFTPLLDEIENSRVTPFPYRVGSSGPSQARHILQSHVPPISKL